MVKFYFTLIYILSVNAILPYGGEFYKGIILSNYNILEYKNDTLIKLSEYNSDQTIYGNYIYEYDDENNICKLLFYNESEELVFYNEYKYYY